MGTKEQGQTMDARTPGFDPDAAVRTRCGGRAEVLHAYSDSLIGQWYDGMRWHLAEWNRDGTYGMKTIPEYLKGRSSGKFELFALQQKDVPKSLDLINHDTETPDLIA